MTTNYSNPHIESDNDYRNRLIQSPKCGVHYAEDIGNSSGSHLDEIGEKLGVERKKR